MLTPPRAVAVSPSVPVAAGTGRSHQVAANAPQAVPLRQPAQRVACDAGTPEKQLPEPMRPGLAAAAAEAGVNRFEESQADGMEMYVYGAGEGGVAAQAVNAEATQGQAAEEAGVDDEELAAEVAKRMERHRRRRLRQQAATRLVGSPNAD